MGLARRKETKMATVRTKPKSAMETLLDKFDGLIDEQAAEMTDEEFQTAEKKFNAVIEKARASRSARHGKD